MARLVQGVDDVGEDLRFPARRSAVVTDAFFQMPAAAVGLPGHLGTLADLLQVDIPLAFSGSLFAVEDFPHGPFPGCQNRAQHFARIRLLQLGSPVGILGGLRFSRLRARKLDRVSDQVFRGPFGNNPATTCARFRSQIDNPVGRFDHVEIMLDDDHGVPQFDQTVQHLQQLANVVEMEAGGGFVQDIESFAGLGSREFSRQFDALGFTPGQRGGGLSEC